MLRVVFAIVLLIGGSGCAELKRMSKPTPAHERRQVASSMLFDIRADEGVEVAPSPDVSFQPASAFEHATYVVWGLPRDLLDVPFTTLNRLGIGTYFTTEGCAPGKRNAMGSMVVIGGAAITGGIVGYAQGWGAAGPHIWQRSIYTNVYAVGGIAVGAGAGLAVTGAYGGVVVPIQTALLRSGFDTEYLKGNHARLDVHDAWTEAAVAAYERHERSLAYFPNWRYGVRGERRTLPVAAASEPPPPASPVVTP